MVAINHEKKPFDDKRVRRALTLALDRYEGSKKLSKIAIVKEVARIQVPGTPYATPPAELEKLAGYGRTSPSPGRGQAAAQGSGRARGFAFTFKNRGIPMPYEPVGDLADRPVAAGRAQREAGGRRGLRLPPHAQAGRLRGGHGLRVRLHRRARPRPATASSPRPTPTTAGTRTRRSTSSSRSRRGPLDARKSARSSCGPWRSG